MNNSWKLTFVLVILIGILIYKNPGEFPVWFFGRNKMSAFEIAALLFISGMIAGYVLRRPARVVSREPDEDNEFTENGISDEDRDYIN